MNIIYGMSWKVKTNISKTHNNHSLTCSLFAPAHTIVVFFSVKTHVKDKIHMPTCLSSICHTFMFHHLLSAYEIIYIQWRLRGFSLCLTSQQCCLCSQSLGQQELTLSEKWTQVPPPLLRLVHPLITCTLSSYTFVLLQHFCFSTCTTVYAF